MQVCVTVRVVGLVKLNFNTVAVGILDFVFLPKLAANPVSVHNTESLCFMQLQLSYGR